MSDLFIHREIPDIPSGRLPLICLHGWGFHGEIWREPARNMAGEREVLCPDLPGHGRSPWSGAGHDLSALSDGLLAEFPHPALWLGWSLGGLIALYHALRHPSRVAGLILVAASPRFTRAEDWPHAMPPAVLADFAQRLEQDCPGTLQRFLALQVHGSESAREQLRHLKPLLAKYPPWPQALAGGLKLLAENDLRQASRELACPCLLCLGQRDTLVPAAMAEDWRQFYPGLQSWVIPGAGHLPFLSHPSLFIQGLKEFCHARDPG